MHLYISTPLYALPQGQEGVSRANNIAMEAISAIRVVSAYSLQSEVLGMYKQVGGWMPGWQAASGGAIGRTPPVRESSHIAASCPGSLLPVAARNARWQPGQASRPDLPPPPATRPPAECRQQGLQQVGALCRTGLWGVASTKI